MSTPEVDSIFPYKPNKVAIFIAIVLYGIGTCVHIFQMVRYRAWYFLPFTIGAIRMSTLLFSLYHESANLSKVMTFGYIMRYVSAQSPADLGPYVVQYLSILLPPSLYAATIYMIYGRLVNWLFPNDRASQRRDRVSLVPARWVTKIFVVGDVISFIMQLAGGGMTSDDSLQNLGDNILIAGLAVQLVFFGTFFTFAIIFERRAARLFNAGYLPPASGEGVDGRGMAQMRKKLMLYLFFGSGMIIARSLFRIIEYAQGHDGYLVSREIFLYIFDAIPMVIVQYTFHFNHAGKVLPRNIGKRGEQVELKDTASQNSSSVLRAV